MTADFAPESLRNYHLQNVEVESNCVVTNLRKCRAARDRDFDWWLANEASGIEKKVA